MPVPSGRVSTPLVLLTLALALAACDDSEGGGTVPIAPVAESVIGMACSPAAACPDPAATCLDAFPEGYCTTGCGTDLACPGDHLCIASRWGEICARRCTGPGDCRAGYSCRPHALEGGGGVCDVEPDDGGGADAGVDGAEPDIRLIPSLGEPCLSSADCDVDQPLSASCLSGFAGGYCSARCEPDSDDCGADAVCLRSSLGGICVLRCDGAPEQCRAGYGCCNVGDVEACLPPDTVEGCEPIGPVGDGQLGDPCTEDRDCGAGDNPGCSLDVPGGYCTSWGCGADPDCGDGGVCLDAFTSLCLRACQPEADDCRADQVCCAVRDDAFACVAPAFCTAP